MNVPNFKDHSQRGGLMAKLLLVFVLLLGLGSILWIMLLPAVVASTIRSRTGFAVKVDKLAANPFTADVTITGLVLKNPAGWPAAEFVDVREFRVEGQLFSLFGSRLVADEIVIDVAQVTVVKNQQGLVNAIAFKDGLVGREAPAGAEVPKAGPKQEFLIKHLVLKVDKLVYADYSAANPKIKQYNLNISRDMRNVDSVTKMISPFTGTALGVITGTLSGLFPNSPDLLGGLEGRLQDVGKKAGETLKGLLDSLDKKKP